jgi:hypothetical protein
MFISVKTNNMKYLLFLIAVLTMACASDKKNDEELSAIKSSMDSLLVEVKSLREELNKEDSTINDTVIIHPIVKKDSAKKEIKTITQPSPSKKETAIVKPKNDTTFHYYINGKVSVKIHPWKNEKRTIELFDLYGNLTFRTEDINMSYSIFNHLHFHSNGAVSKIEESMNPGASMYMYKSIMTFSTTNNPEVRTNHKWPSTLEDEMESQIPWFWDKKTMQWVKQEIIYETNTPPKN